MDDEPAANARDDDIRVGKNLARMRAALSVSQADLAQGIGVAQQTIAKIERGTRSLKYSEARQICAALNLPMSLLAQEDQQSVNTATLVSHHTQMISFERELYDFAARLAPSLVKMAFDTVNARSLSLYERPTLRDLDRTEAWLSFDWGGELNRAILKSLPTDDELRNVDERELDSETYAAVLENISQLKAYINAITGRT